MINKKYILIIILVIIVIAGFFVFRKKPTMAPAEITTIQNETKSQEITPELVSIGEDSYLYEISGSYPKFSQSVPEINKKIKEFVESSISDFKEEANDNYQARLETGGADFEKDFANNGGFSYQVKTEVIQSNNQFISVLIHSYGFSGGAHGYATTTSFNYDVKNKSEITLADLFPSNKDYLKTISESARIQLTEKLKKASEQSVLDENISSMMIDGTDPTRPENFKVFTFTDNTITIYFGQYQVAPYVYGEQSIEILRK